MSTDSIGFRMSDANKWSGDGHQGGGWALAAVVVGVAGIAGVPLLGPVAWIMARRELAAVAEGRRPPASAGLARAARLLGMVGTALLVAVSATFLLALTGVIAVG